MSTLQGQIVINTVKKLALGAVQNGTMVFDSDLSALQIFIDGSWQTLASTSITNAIADDVKINETAISTKQPTIKRARFREYYADNTNGGTFTAGDWRTRLINNVEYNEITGASLSTNRITLPAGTFIIKASAPAVICDRHQTRLMNITTNTIISAGTCEFIQFNAYTQTRSFLETLVTFADETVIELQHFCASTYATFGFGVSTNSSVSIYAVVDIKQVA